MSTIAEKLDLFLSAPERFSQSPLLLLDHQEFIAYGFKNPSNFRYCLFEPFVRLNSPSMIGRYPSFVGAHSYIGSGGYFQNAWIGRYSSIGKSVAIGASSHELGGLTTHPALSAAKSRVEPVIIQNDVWIGDGSIVMPGITLATGCVVGANSVVTKNVDPFSIVAGAPARHLRFRITDPELRGLILRSQWWECDYELLLSTRDLEIYERIERVCGASYPALPLDTFSTASIAS